MEDSILLPHLSHRPYNYRADGQSLDHYPSVEALEVVVSLLVRDLYQGLSIVELTLDLVLIQTLWRS